MKFTCLICQANQEKQYEFYTAGGNIEYLRRKHVVDKHPELKYKSNGTP